MRSGRVPLPSGPAARAGSGRARAGGGPSTLADRVLALQRSAGNRAVAALVARTPQLQRCGCRGSGTCACSGKDEEEPDEQRRRLLRAPRTTLARITEPDFQPKPAWSKKGADNPADDCTPFPGLWGKPVLAHEKWQFYATRVPGEITKRCGCALAGEAYTAFFEAKGKLYSLDDNGNCISVQLSQDDAAHKELEERLLDKWQDRGGPVVRQALAGGGDAEIDLVKALEGTAVPVGPGPLAEMKVNSDITYKKNSLAGGLLFGSATADDTEQTKDSEYGADTRRLSGTIKLHSSGAPDATTLDVDETLTFRYRTRDALDFCPGNTLRKPVKSVEDFEYNQLLSDLSRIEASGMGRDVGFDVRYHRTKTTSRRLSRPPPAADAASRAEAEADPEAARQAQGRALPARRRRVRADARRMPRGSRAAARGRPRRAGDDGPAGARRPHTAARPGRERPRG